MYYAFSIEYTVLQPTSFAVRSHRMTVGVVKADSIEAAEQLVWDKMGNDYAHNLRVYPITDDLIVVGEM